MVLPHRIELWTSSLPRKGSSFKKHLACQLLRVIARLLACQIRVEQNAPFDGGPLKLRIVPQVTLDRPHVAPAALPHGGAKIDAAEVGSKLVSQPVLGELLENRQILSQHLSRLPRSGDVTDGFKGSDRLGAPHFQHCDCAPLCRIKTSLISRTGVPAVRLIRTPARRQEQRRVAGRAHLPLSLIHISEPTRQAE